MTELPSIQQRDLKETHKGGTARGASRHYIHFSAQIRLILEHRFIPVSDINEYTVRLLRRHEVYK